MRARGALTWIVAAVLLLSACVEGESGGSPTSPQGRVTSPSSALPSPWSSPTPPAASPPAVESREGLEPWTTHGIEDGSVTLQLPPGWRIEETQTPFPADTVHAGEWRTEATVYDSEDRARLVYDEWGPMHGVHCLDPVPYETLDWRPVGIQVASEGTASAWSVSPRAAYRAIEVPGGWALNIGVTDKIAGQAGRACSLMDFFVPEGRTRSVLFGSEVNTMPSSPADVATLEEARAWIDSPDYERVMTVLTSIRFSD